MEAEERARRQSDINRLRRVMIVLVATLAGAFTYLGFAEPTPQFLTLIKVGMVLNAVVIFTTFVAIWGLSKGLQPVPDPDPEDPLPHLRRAA